MSQPRVAAGLGRLNLTGYEVFPQSPMTTGVMVSILGSCDGVMGRTGPGSSIGPVGITGTIGWGVCAAAQRWSCSPERRCGLADRSFFVCESLNNIAAIAP